MTVKMTSEEAIRNEINTRRQQIADGVNMVTRERMEAEIATFEDGLKGILAKQTEEEKRVDALQQQIQEMDLLGSILPEAQLINANVSLTEYGMMRQEMNQFLHAWAMDIEKTASSARDAEVSEISAKLQDKNEDIKAGKEREEYLKQQISDLQREKQTLQQNLSDTQSALEETVLEVKKEQEQNANCHKIIDSLNEKISELEKPKPAPQTSTSVQEHLEGLRKKSAESWAEKANRGLARFDLPPLEEPTLPKLQEVSQQGITFPTAELASDQLPPAETVENVNSFRTEEIPSGLGSTEGGTDQGVQESFEQWATREINELKRAVYGEEQAVA